MKKLRIILQSKYFYFILTGIVFLYVAVININGIYKSKYSVNDNLFIGVITEFKVDGNKLSVKLNSKEKLIVNYYIKAEEEKNYIINNYKLGIKLKIIGQLKEPSINTNFNLFNYKKYLLGKKIYWCINTEKIEIINNDINILYKAKNKIIERINSMASASYLKLFILGENDLDSEIYSTYKNNGVSHLLAISGMHISIITSIFSSLLKKIIKNKYISFIITSIFLFFYLFLVDFLPSVIRAVMMYIFINIKKVLNLEINNIFILLLILSILLIVNPFYINNIGFIFSFVISFYLILFSKIINNYKNYFVKLFITSLIAFLVSIPILINNFNEINLLSPLINLLIVPFVSFVIFPFSLITFFIPIFDNVFIILTNFLEILSRSFCKINFLTLNLCKVNILIIILYYIFITIIIYKKFKYILIFFVILIIHSNIRLFYNNSVMTLLDVGQGDSTLIELPHNKGNILIDTGGSISYENEKWQMRENEYSIATNLDIPYLKSKGIKYINYLILTHGDYDHMGEAINLVENFKVENVIFNCGTYNDLEQELIKVLDKKKINYYSCIKELNIDKYKLKFLNTKEYDNENDNSNVIYFKYNNYKFLFMGDASVEREKDILEKYNLSNIDFLKVGHHGSNTSSSEEFINSINPKYSLISVGKNNRYGHPKDEVLDTLKNSKIYRTDLDGSIEIKLNKNGYRIRTCPP